MVAARWPSGPRDSMPGPFGAHNWHSMSFSPQTGLAYMPAQNIPLTLMDDKDWSSTRTSRPGRTAALGWNTATFIDVEPPKSKPFGRLIAWDPVAQKEAWRVEHVSPWNGGTLATAGNLVFQGTADGRFVAYNAKTGDKLWEMPPAPAWSRRRPPTWWTASSTCRSRWAGAVSTASPRAPPSARARARCTRSCSAATRQEPEFVQRRMDKLVQRRQVRPGQGAGRHAAVREQLRLLPWRAGRATAAATSRTWAT